MKTLLLTLELSLLGGAVWAAPKPPKPPKPVAPVRKLPVNSVEKIDARASLLVGRAAALYKPLKSLAIAWSSVEVSPDGKLDDPANATRTEIDWEKRGRIRLATPGGMDDLVVVDGKKKWTLDGTEYSVEPIKPEEAEVEAGVVFQMSDSLSFEITELLEGDNYLNADEVKRDVAFRKMQVYRAVVLEPQTLNGEQCDLVEVDKQFYDGPSTPNYLKVEKKIYWFARKDGRLKRLQINSKWGKIRAESSETTITKQELNPTFPLSTFTFTPPAGAKLKK